MLLHVVKGAQMQVTSSPVPTPDLTQSQQAVTAPVTSDTGDAPLDTAPAEEAGKFAKQIEKFANFAKGSANAQAVHARLAEAFAAKQSAAEGEHVNIGQIVSGKAPLPSETAAAEVTALAEAETAAAPAAPTDPADPALTDGTEGSDDAALALVQAAVEAAVSQPTV